MMELRERGETQIQRKEFANQFCTCAEIPAAAMIFYDGLSKSITEYWTGRREGETGEHSSDMIKMAERRLAEWATVRAPNPIEDQPDQVPPVAGDIMVRIRAEGHVLCIGAPVRGVYPALVFPDGPVSDKDQRRLMLRMCLAYVSQQLSNDVYARCARMESLVVTAMQVLSIQFLVVRADARIVFDSLENLPHQAGSEEEIIRNRKSFLKMAADNPDLRKAIHAATLPKKMKTSIVSIFSSPGVARLMVVAPLKNSDTPMALVLFENDNTDHFKLRQHFFNAYRLSRAESQVAHEILNGRSVSEAAAASELSLHTVRSYMKQIFAKTGTHKQSELISLYFGSTLPVTANLDRMTGS